METVIDFFLKLFSTKDFPARWHCGKWTDFHGWLYIISDLAIWAAYFAIPLLLFYFIFKRKNVPFNGVFVLFIVFILACGLTHLIDAVIFWVPVYRLSAFVRFITAVASVWTVIALLKVLPKAMELKTSSELEAIVLERTVELEEKNAKLLFAHQNLQQSHAEVEQKVNFRTQLLQEENDRLKKELDQLRNSN